MKAKRKRTYWVDRCRGAGARFLKLVALLKIDPVKLRERYPDTIRLGRYADQQEHW